MKFPIHSGGFAGKDARKITQGEPRLAAGEISSAYHGIVRMNNLIV